MFPEIGRVKNFLSFTRLHNRMCIKINVFNFKKKQSKKTTRQKAKDTKEEKRVSVKNLTGYDYMVCEFAQCIFNLLDRFVNFPRLLFSLCAPREITVFVLLHQHMKYTL